MGVSREFQTKGDYATCRSLRRELAVRYVGSQSFGAFILLPPGFIGFIYLCKNLFWSGLVANQLLFVFIPICLALVCQRANEFLRSLFYDYRGELEELSLIWLYDQIYVRSSFLSKREKPLVKRRSFPHRLASPLVKEFVFLLALSAIAAAIIVFDNRRLGEPELIFSFCMSCLLGLLILWPLFALFMAFAWYGKTGREIEKRMIDADDINSRRIMKRELVTSLRGIKTFLDTVYWLAKWGGQYLFYDKITGGKIEEITFLLFMWLLLESSYKENRLYVDALLDEKFGWSYRWLFPYSKVTWRNRFLARMANYRFGVRSKAAQDRYKPLLGA